MQVVQTDLFRDLLNLPTGAFSVLAAGLVMGVMIIPTIASLSEDALSAVPLGMRQGSAALGANRMQTTLKVVFPAALSGHRRRGRPWHLARGRRDDDRGDRWRGSRRASSKVRWRLARP